MLVSETNLSATALMLLYPNDLFGIDVDIFFLDVGYLDQNAHMILPVVQCIYLRLGERSYAAGFSRLAERCSLMSVAAAYHSLV